MSNRVDVTRLSTQKLIQIVSEPSHRPDLVLKGLETTLSDLGLDYLDLFLMHWPVASEPGTGKTSLGYVNVGLFSK